MKRIEELLRETMGLDAASIGSSLIQRATRQRMKMLGLKRLEDYRQMLATSRAEWDALVESVVVIETWFFRDREPFQALTRLVFENWLPAHPRDPIRLLSLPCASGEEPYSMAMALQDAGVPPSRYQIDAADISRRALAKALHGTYRNHSFRGEDLNFRDRYFTAGREGFSIKPEVRQGVSFYQGNVLADKFLAGKAPYDFIFCRNLLIYFDPPTQRRALQAIDQLLSPKGVLFVGAAEVPLVTANGFVSAALPMAFACRKPHPAPITEPTNISGPSTGWPVFPSGGRRDGRNPATARPLVQATPPGHRAAVKPAMDSGCSATPASATASLSEARRYADSGRLREAAAICERHLRQHGATAEAYYLLGLIRDAQGDTSAVDCYRKALYLEPDHYETLLQMALLSQRNGDDVRADSFKRRAKKVSGLTKQ